MPENPSGNPPPPGNRTDDALLVYVTAPDAAEARRIGRALVEERLAACVNVLPAHEAIYRWEGRVEEAREVALLAKTTRAGFEPLRARVRALHPYDTPCIVALPVAAGDAGYLAWIRAEAPREEAPRERTPGEGTSKEETSREGTP